VAAPPPAVPEVQGGEHTASQAAEAQQGPSAAPEAPPPTAPNPVAEMARKTALCDLISRALKIPVLCLVKITGKEPQYRMELADNRKIEFANVNKLIEYGSVRSAIAASVGKIIPKIKAKEWEVISQAMLDACIIVEGTEEMDWEGAARMYLQHYLFETGLIPSIEEQRLQDQRKPFVIDGEITVCAGHFQLYVNKTTFQALSVKAVAGMLSALGARPIRVRSPKHKDQSRWVLPAPDFDPEEYKQWHDAGGTRAIQ